ncbi:MAG: RNA polymerase sigma factor, partial [Flavobacteriales bacterium]|nr:RNA polymerase sigma factor [Flavobacteriales bacterium]
MQDVKSVIEGCIKEDRKSQKKVYELYYSKMMGVCLRYSKDADDAKDILQEAFIKVFGSIKNYGDKGSFEGWIRRIVVNTAIDYYRKKSKESFVTTNSDYVNNLDRPDDDEEIDLQEVYNVNVKELVAEIQNLSPAYKAVFNMYVVEGYSH